jgi:hypothetical protein
MHMLNAGYPMLNRRHFLKHLAGYSAMAVAGSRFVQGLASAAPALKKNNKSIIILWMSGGPPTIDIWDLKPGQPTGGDFRPIKTSAAGVEICEHMPQVARQMKHLAIIRSLATTEGDHNRGRTLMHTGRAPSPIVTYPSLGSMVSFQLTPPELELPGFISIGRPADGPGFLGMNYAPFTVQNPGQPPENIRPPQDMADDKARVFRRERLFYGVEDNFVNTIDKLAGKKHADAATAHRDSYHKAFSLVASPKGEVFNVNRESRKTLENYGAARSNFGKGCLLARRLVEQGVTAVEVDLGGWDLHQNCQAACKTKLPELDKAMGALVEDLVQRGLWKNTVLVWMGEFGRTPRINANAGRDHWPACWSVVVGGGGIKGGQVIGATDTDGTGIKDDRHSVGDLFATLFKGLGLDPKKALHDNLGRRLNLAPDNSEVIKGLV